MSGQCTRSRSRLLMSRFYSAKFERLDRLQMNSNVDVIKITLDEGVDDFDDLRYVSDCSLSGSEVGPPSETDLER
jgi:hypothetical protein